MTPGPLRRLIGAIGLVVLAPIAYRLVEGSMSPVDAALRAVATLVAVVLVGRLLGSWLGQVALTYDRQGGHEDAPRAAAPAGDDRGAEAA